MDLGKSYTSRDVIKNTLSVNIKDSFVNKFFKEYGSLIYKTAVVGPVSIYTFSSLSPTEILIYRGDEKFTFEIDALEAEENIELCFAKLIMGLDKKETE